MRRTGGGGAAAAAAAACGIVTVTEDYCRMASFNPKEYLRDLSEKPVNEELMPYHYLILQAGAFGSKQIWIDNVGTGWKWCNNTFRSYWLPTETSNRKSPVNPMIPMPDTLYSRVSDIVEYGTKYITAYHKDVLDMVDIINNDSREKVIYIDPPYMNTTGYFNNFNIYELLPAFIFSSICIVAAVPIMGSWNTRPMYLARLCSGIWVRSTPPTEMLP